MSTNKQWPTQKLIILFSGKRKSGREFLATALLSRLGESVAEIVRICEPAKRRWAIKMAYNVDELVGPLKEQYRQEMITWSDKVQAQLPTFFCSEAFKSAKKPITIVSDIRRQIDMDYFSNLNVPLLAVRVNTSEEERKSRGWVFSKGIDDVAFECDLDDFKEWDFVIDGDNGENAENVFQNIKRNVDYVLQT